MTGRNRPQVPRGLSGEIARVLTDVEQVFRESEARIEAILRTAADAIITIDASGDIESFNPAAEQMFGHTCSEVLGRNVSILMAASKRGQHSGHIARYILTGESNVVGHRRRLEGLRKDGSVFPMELSVSEVQLGTRRLFTGIARDISLQENTLLELQTSRLFMRATLDSLPQHIAILDESGSILKVNEAWRKFACADHLLPRTQHVGENYLDVCERTAKTECPQAGDVAEGIRRVIRGDQEYFQMEYPCHAGDERRWFALYVTRFDSDNGVRAVVIHENISSRKIAELELAAAKEAAEASNRMKDEFLAMLGHELRNPLAPIRNATALLQRDALPEPVREQALKTLSEQVDHVVHLVDDLLDLTRIDHGKIRIQLQPIDLRDCLRRAVEATQALFQQRRHEFDIDVPDRRIMILGDGDRLQQVVANLLNNAAKYTPKGGHIRLTLKQETPDALICVQDNGIGMSASDLRRVFDAFAQASDLGAEGVGGLGLGLTLVRRLVELHDGSVQATSDGPDQGSRVVVRLPLLPATYRIDEPVARADPHYMTQQASHRILVVDDNHAAADMLAALLEIDGHEVCAAYDGETGIQQALQQHPQVILLDIRMPGMNGFEVARRLREIPQLETTVLVAMTGLSQQKDIERSLQNGFDRHLVKPINPADLQGLLDDLPEPAMMDSSR